MTLYRGAGGGGNSTDDALVTQVQTYATQAQTSATQAATSATNSSTSAASAATAASNAAASASTASGAISSAQSAAALAQTYKNEADSSADDAAAEALLAAAYRLQAQNSAVAAASSATEAAQLTADLSADLAAVASNKNAAQAAETQAGIYATNSANSSTSAASSAASASTSASTATTKAGEASTSATNAAASAATAVSASNTASTKASEASTSATNAASSASAASTSASSASTSASAASSSASSASSSASAASTSATNAASSASAASTSASNAASSATSSLNSANSAATAQSAAEAARDVTLAAFDSFDDRYLGAKSSDPTLDNDGNALAAGAIYFNTTASIMKVYTGSLWVAAYVSGTDFLAKANNLSDLPSAATARTNLGLGSAATTSSTDYATAAQGAKADTAYGWGNHASAGYLTSIADGSVTPAKLSTGAPTWNSSGNLGLGVTPSSVLTNYRFFQLGTTGVNYFGGAGSMGYAYNGYYNAGWKYNGTGNATLYDTDGSSHKWSIAPSGTAGTAITFTQAMTLDASGNLGVGTSSPGAKLQVGSATYAPNGNLSNNLVQIKSASGYAYLTIGNGDTANATSYIGGASGLTVFGSVTDAGSLTERMRIDSSGNVGIGTSSPINNGSSYATLTLNGSIGGVLELATAGVSKGQIYTDNTNIVYNTYAGAHKWNYNGAEKMRLSTAGGFSVGTSSDPGAGAIYATGNITAYYSSDRTLKENIKDVDGALDKVCAIGSKTFDWTDEYIAAHGGEDGYFVQKSDFGVVAQDVQAVFPQAVRTREDGTLAVDYEKLSTLAFGAIKELLKRVEALEAK